MLDVCHFQVYKSKCLPISRDNLSSVIVSRKPWIYMLQFVKPSFTVVCALLYLKGGQKKKKKRSPAICRIKLQKYVASVVSINRSVSKCSYYLTV